jgi:hypothetical protein
MVEPALPIMPPHTADGTTSFTMFLFASSSFSAADAASVPVGRHKAWRPQPVRPPNACACGGAGMMLHRIASVWDACPVFHRNDGKSWCSTHAPAGSSASSLDRMR